MSITPEMVRDLRGREVYDAHSDKVGKVGEVYVDNTSGEPRWVTVNTGMLGTKESFVPLDGATAGSDGVHVATEKKTIKDAPSTGDNAGELSESEERRLYSHYGLTAPSAADGRADSARGGDRDGDRDRAAGRDGRDSHDSHDSHGTDNEKGMSRSEERLSVGKENVETGEVRLRKYVVTENQSVEVPVSHEEVRVEREAVSGDRPARGTVGEDEQAVTLHAERPVVDKEAYEVERVRLDTRTVTENQTFSDEVRKEQIEVADPSNLTRDEKNDKRDER
jgi:uncharacterized protein (TIGR02271 family)